LYQYLDRQARRGRSLGQASARINTISPGIIFTPLARDELTGPRGEGYRRMIELSPGADGAFITGSDFLMDGGVTGQSSGVSPAT